ncbi:g6875 [Coccomyxa elongata]
MHLRLGLSLALDVFTFRPVSLQAIMGVSIALHHWTDPFARLPFAIRCRLTILVLASLPVLIQAATAVSRWSDTEDEKSSVPALSHTHRRTLGAVTCPTFPQQKLIMMSVSKYIAAE